MGLSHGQGSPLLAGPLSHSPLCDNGLAPNRSERTRVPLSLNAQRRFMIWQMRGLFLSSPSIACKQDIESRVDYNTVLYRIHVPKIAECQCDCCCFSSKDGTVIWESFGQLAASRLTILEMAVDDRCCPHSLVNLRSVSVDFIIWSLSIAIL